VVRINSRLRIDRPGGDGARRVSEKGLAVKISNAKRELKAQHALSQQEVQRNLTYLPAVTVMYDAPVPPYAVGTEALVISSEAMLRAYYQFRLATIEAADLRMLDRVGRSGWCAFVGFLRFQSGLF
jgi:hypothetical protein